jgi:restriction system protein
METEDAFSSLLNTARVELEKVQQEGAAHFAKGDTAKVRQAADRVEKIKDWIASLERMQREWDIPTPEAKPQTLNLSVHSEKANYGRTPPGIRTSQKDFWIAILEVLVEMGGKGRANKVLDRVEQKMVHVLNDIDRQILKGGGSIRWRNTAQWGRLDLVHLGYLSDSSPQGIWEITEAGRKYLQNRRNL